MTLQLGMNVAEHQVAIVLVDVRDLRLKRGEDVQLRVERGAAREIGGVFAGPEETFSRRPLDTDGGDAAFAEDAHLGVGEIVADHGDHAHLREVAGGQRKICGRAGQQLIALAVCGLDRVKSNGTYDENGHWYRIARGPGMTLNHKDTKDTKKRKARELLTGLTGFTGSRSRRQVGTTHPRYPVHFCLRSFGFSCLFD